MTPEELKEALDSGKTIQELADAAGIELPERPDLTEQKAECGPRGAAGGN